MLTTRPVEPASTMDAMLMRCCGYEVGFGVVIEWISFTYIFYEYNAVMNGVANPVDPTYPSVNPLSRCALTHLLGVHYRAG